MSPLNFLERKERKRKVGAKRRKELANEKESWTASSKGRKKKMKKKVAPIFPVGYWAPALLFFFNSRGLFYKILL